jgi:hypothetical protein
MCDRLKCIENTFFEIYFEKGVKIMLCQNYYRGLQF